MQYYYHQMAKKYIVAVASIINDIHIHRTDAEGTLLKDIKVPITFAGKSKLAYVLSNIDRETLNDTPVISTILPRIGFILSEMRYDSTRKRNSLNEIKIGGTNTTFLHEGNPYTFTFDVAVLAKNQDDLMQIVEQIATQFTPDVSLTVKEIPEIGIERDVSVSLVGVNLNSTLEYSEFDDRTIVADLTFELKGYLYRPIMSATVIEHITANLVNKETLAQIASIEHDYNDITTNIDTLITEQGA